MGLLDWILSATDAALEARKDAIRTETDWESGSILDGDFDEEIEEYDAIDEEIGKRRDAANARERKPGASYGVHREHGWYLPNDDDD